jgi:RNA polymerase sigma-70 factor (ECF subfamily)
MTSWWPCARRRAATDDRPIQELLHRYQNMVWRVCYSFMRNPQDAEDLTQEVFLRVYRSLPHFEGGLHSKRGFTALL